ncbi:hypothetical protein [Natronorubrum halophilum]|nr:hypothetical protein [Natronorubrum halophilum]
MVSDDGGGVLAVEQQSVNAVAVTGRSARGAVSSRDPALFLR